MLKDTAWRTASAVGAVGLRPREPLLLVSRLPVMWGLVVLYRQRAAIEALRPRLHAGASNAHEVGRASPFRLGHEAFWQQMWPHNRAPIR